MRAESRNTIVFFFLFFYFRDRCAAAVLHLTSCSAVLLSFSALLGGLLTKEVDEGEGEEGGGGGREGEPRLSCP